MILFLDDEKWRHDLMEKHHPGQVRHVYNCVQLFKALREPFQKFDQIWLDHDLGQFDDKDPVQGDGMVAAQMVVSAFNEQLLEPFMMIRIHSFNESAARRMFDLLEEELGEQDSIDVVRLPFSIEFPGVIQVDQALQSSHHGQSISGAGGTAGSGADPAGQGPDEAPESPGAGDSVQIRSGESGGGGTGGPDAPVEGELK